MNASSFMKPSLMLSAVLMTVVILGGSALSPSRVGAAGASPVTGWAWSQYMGWISFNGTGYGVSEDSTGALSGYAWSSNLGWITFNASEVSGCPSGTCAPKVDLATGKVTGWARACSAFANKDLCSGALDANSGGWDGWIALSGTAQNNQPYGITQNTTNSSWSGYAWGSDAIGAISMSGTASDGLSYGVTGPTLTPTRPTLDTDTDIVDSNGSATLTWSGLPWATSCTFVGGSPSTEGATSGSASTGPLTSETSYVVRCLGASGSSMDSLPVTIRVRTPVINTFSALPNRVASGGKTTVSWDVNGAASCTIKRNGVDWRTLSKSGTSITGSTIDTVTVTTTYILACGAASPRTAVVNIIPSFQEF